MNSLARRPARSARAAATTSQRVTRALELARVREYANGPDPFNLRVLSVNLTGTSPSGQPRFRIVTSDGARYQADGVEAVHGFFASLARSIKKHPGYLLAGLAVVGGIGFLAAGAGSSAAAAGAAASTAGATGGAAGWGTVSAIQAATTGAAATTATTAAASTSFLGSIGSGVLSAGKGVLSVVGLTSAAGAGAAPQQAEAPSAFDNTVAQVGNLYAAASTGINPGFTGATTAAQVTQFAITAATQKALADSFGTINADLAAGKITPAQAQQMMAQQQAQAQAQQQQQLQAQQAAAQQQQQVAQLENTYRSQLGGLLTARKNYAVAQMQGDTAGASTWGNYYTQVGQYLSQILAQLPADRAQALTTDTQNQIAALDQSLSQAASQQQAAAAQAQQVLAVIAQYTPQIAQAQAQARQYAQAGQMDLAAQWDTYAQNLATWLQQLHSTYHV